MMKKVLKVLGVIALAAAIACSGYWFGQKNERDKNSLTSAMPKQSIDKPQENIDPSESTPPDASMMPRDDIQNGIDDRTITRMNTSAVVEGENWTKVTSNTLSDGSGTVSLYTSAEKLDEEFIWDDSQKWIVELDDGNGGYYTFYDQNVSNGMVYYDVANRDNGDIIITVFTVSNAGTAVTQYTRTDSDFTEKTVYNSGAVNRIYSSIPDYR